MTRTRSGKTLTELLVMAVVLLGLGAMLTHTVQKVRAASGRSEPAARVSVNLKGSQRTPAAP
jgi:hypothetical protein